MATYICILLNGGLCNAVVLFVVDIVEDVQTARAQENYKIVKLIEQRGATRIAKLLVKVTNSTR